MKRRSRRTKRPKKSMSFNSYRSALRVRGPRKNKKAVKVFFTGGTQF